MSLSVQIEKAYGAFHLNVSFEAEREVLALLGASGCGKSLTLKCIAGIEKPDRGKIVLDGRVLFDSENKICLPPQQRKVGYLFQQYALFPNMTVEQNIAAGSRLRRGSERTKRVQELVEMFHLEDTLGKLPRQLSGGQQQRVALARILASEPEVILLDEPFSALDSYLKWQLEMEMRELLSLFGGSVLWVSHDRGEVYRNCSRVCVLDQGQSLPVTDMNTLMTAPVTLSAARLAGYQNFIRAEATEDPYALLLPDWSLTLRSGRPWTDGITHIGLRAEEIRPARDEAENCIPCQVLSATEDLACHIVMLRPKAARPDTPLLRVELPKSAPIPEKELTVYIPPEAVSLLHS